MPSYAINMISIRKGSCLLNLPTPLQPLLATRLYATQTGLGTTGASPRPRRKAVTAFNDDGRVAWGDLTAREKAARTTQQTFNFGLIIAGAALTVWSKQRTEIEAIANAQQGGVVYVLYTHVFAPDSVTNNFNRAVDKVKKDERCVGLLGNSKKITAYGEPTSNKWAKSRPIAYVLPTDVPLWFSSSTVIKLYGYLTNSTIDQV